MKNLILLLSCVFALTACQSKKKQPALKSSEDVGNQCRKSFVSKKDKVRPVGTVTLKWKVDSEGNVFDPQVSSRTTKNSDFSKFESCVKNDIKKVTYAPAEGVREFTDDYLFD